MGFGFGFRHCGGRTVRSGEFLLSDPGPAIVADKQLKIRWTPQTFASAVPEGNM